MDFVTSVIVNYSQIQPFIKIIKMGFIVLAGLIYLII
jgi:hypothetical protein